MDETDIAKVSKNVHVTSEGDLDGEDSSEELKILRNAITDNCLSLNRLKCRISTFIAEGYQVACL